jgi:SAM-dependent methyltransferase
MGGVSAAGEDARRTSFGTLVDADRYDDVRPEYPPEAVAWLLGGPGGAPAGGPGGGHPARVLDLAAGTGKLTRAVRALGHEVVAVDPSEGMLATLLAAGGEVDPGVHVLRGTAEDVPLPDACVDAVVVGQAWHWVRPRAAVAEVTRVLRPGGVLGLAWNRNDTDEPWVAQLEALVSPGGRSEPGPEQEDDGWPRVPGPLRDRERARFRADQVLAGPAAVAALASTHSAVAVRHDREEVLRRVAELAAAHTRPDGTVLVPVLCHAFRYRRP